MDRLPPRTLRKPRSEKGVSVVTGTHSVLCAEYPPHPCPREPPLPFIKPAASLFQGCPLHRLAGSAWSGQRGVQGHQQLGWARNAKGWGDPGPRGSGVRAVSAARAG